MKKIILKRAQGQPQVIYVADDVFAHMRPSLTPEQQTELLKFIGVMLAKTGKPETHYLQYAYFNPVGNQQLSLYLARESNPKNVVQMKPGYDPESVASSEFSIQIEDVPEQEQVKANERFIGLQKAAKEAIQGENNPPVNKKNEQFEYASEDSRERRKAAAVKLFKLKNKQATDAEAVQFAEFVITPEAAFNPEIRAFSNRDEIIQMGQFITAISEQDVDESAETTEYRRALAETLQHKLDVAQQATIGVITNAAKQMDMNEKRISIEGKIEAYTRAKDARGVVIAKLATALHNAAKEYYLSIWQHDKYSLDAEIQAFNTIFGKIIKIDPLNLSLTSLEDVFAALNAGKMKTDDIEKIITDILNAAYGTIGSQKRQQSRDAIEFLIKHFNQADPDHAYFPVIERLHTKHQFQFNDTARKQLKAFDDANQKLQTADEKDVAEIYSTGSNLVAMAHEVKEAAQSDFNKLSELTESLNTSRENLRLFPAIVAQKNASIRKLAVIQEQLPNPDNLPSPAANPILGGLTQIIDEMNDVITAGKRALQQAIQAFNQQVQHQQTELDAILDRAHQSTSTLTPLSSEQFATDFSAADERAAELEQNVVAVQQQYEDTKTRIHNHIKNNYDILQCQLLVNALYNLQYWQNTTGTFGIQAKVTLDGQPHIVPKEIGAMLEMIKDVRNYRWESDAETARALITNLQDYAAQHPTSNQHVNRLYQAIQVTRPANNNTPLDNIGDNIQQMGNLVPQPLTRITESTMDATDVAPSRFWQRHPVLKKALIGALIGTIIPVVGTIIGLIVGTVIGKRDEKRAQHPQRARAEVRRKSNNPFDEDEVQQPLLGSGTSQAQIHAGLERKYEGNPFVETEQVEGVPSQNFDELDKLMEDIDKINPDEVVARLPKLNPSFFDAKAAAQQKHAFENELVSNLLQTVYALKAPMTSDKSLPTLRSDMESLRKMWNPKEKSQATRDKNLRNLIETLQISYRSSCTNEFITSVIKKTAEQHPQLDPRMFVNSPLKQFGIDEIAASMQKNRLM